MTESPSAGPSGQPATGPASGPPGVGQTFAVYTGLRVLLFAGSYGVLLVLGVPGLLALAFAFLLSGVLSLLLLRRPRDRFVTALESRRAAKVVEQARLRGLLDEGPPPA